MTRRRAGELAYSKVCDLQGDAAGLADAYQLVDIFPEALQGQHPIRRWEYAMAIHTIADWHARRAAALVTGRDDAGNPESADLGEPLVIADVGGAGSNFWMVLRNATAKPVVLIDERYQGMATGAFHPDVWVAPCTVEDYAGSHAHGQFDVVTTISVIEHVKEVRKFLRAIAMLLKPGGLLFLTTDYWEAEGPDTAHFHWMRERIYNADRMRKLLADCRELGFRSFGEADWSWNGPQVHDYSMCSAALVRK